VTASDGWLERELLRVRDRVHDLSNEVQKLQGIDAERGRDLRRLERAHGKAIDDVAAGLQKLGEEVSEMAVADEIADAVADRLNVAGLHAEGRRFTRLQAWGVRVAIGAAVAGGVAELARALGLHG
jgi:DNA repair ATPase RecN